MEKNNGFKEYAKYASLNVLGMLGLSFYILADTFFIAKGLGADGLTALNLAIPVYSIIHGSGLMLGMGGATRYAVFKSRGKHREADRIFTAAMCLTALFAVLFVAAGAFLAGSIASLMGADNQVFGMTRTYIKVILLFAPAFLSNDVLLCFVRNDGAPRLAMVAMLCGSLSNVLLDYLFIFPFQMGIFGAVLATGFAPLIGMAVLSRHLTGRKNGFRLLKEKPDFRLGGGILSLGLSSLIAELSSGVVIIVFNMILLRLLGNVGVAAYGVIANLSLVTAAVFTGLAQGVQPLVSRAHGRGDAVATRRLLRYALISMAALSAVIYGGVLWFAPQIAGAFNSEGNRQLQELAVEGLRLYFSCTAFMGFNIILAAFFASVERAVPAQIISLSRGLLIVVPMTFALSALWGATGVWLALPAAEGAVAVLAAGMYVRDNRE